MTVVRAVVKIAVDYSLLGVQQRHIIEGGWS
jgi:hypothetical protein